jgi:NitT/TauT family transport system substrate-binding protein
MHHTRARILSMVAGGAAAVMLPKTAGAQTPVIRIGQNANDAFGEGYYSAEQGYFSAAGLNVEITTFANGAAQAAACAGGAIDVGLGEATELANGIIRVLPFVVFAGGVMYDSAAQIQALVVAPDSNIRTAKDFEGQTIAVPALVSISSMAVKQWLVKSGADLSKEKFVELSQPAMTPAVVRGTVAGAHIGEPFLSGAGPAIRKVAIPAEAIARSYLINEWFTTRDWLAANGATARKLANAIYDTARWANGHQNDSAVILSKYTKIEVEKIRGMARAKYATALQPQLIQPVLDMAFTYGGLPRHVDAAEMIGRV